MSGEQVIQLLKGKMPDLEKYIATDTNFTDTNFIIFKNFFVFYLFPFYDFVANRMNVFFY
jgi:hypothetical protein